MTSTAAPLPPRRRTAPIAEPLDRTTARRPQIGSCLPLPDGTAWRWDDAAAGLHGLEPGVVVPTDALLLAHCAAERRPELAALLAGGPERAVRYRLTAADGIERQVLAVATAPAGQPHHRAPVLLVDLSAEVEALAGERADAMLAAAVASRGVIDQAKAALMLVYAIDEARAFDLLRWHSEHLNVKVRDTAAALMDALRGAGTSVPDMRDTVDAVLARRGGEEPGPVADRGPGPAGLRVTRSAPGPRVTVQMEGEVDAATVPALVAELNGALRGVVRHGALVIDLTRVDRLGPLAALHLGRLRRRAERAEVALLVLPPATPDRGFGSGIGAADERREGVAATLR